MRIGEIDLGERAVVLAPMEDVTDASFRILCREAGADMVYTEFISADGQFQCVRVLVFSEHRQCEEQQAEKNGFSDIHGNNG